MQINPRVDFWPLAACKGPVASWINVRGISTDFVQNQDCHPLSSGSGGEKILSVRILQVGLNTWHRPSWRNSKAAPRSPARGGPVSEEPYCPVCPRRWQPLKQSRHAELQGAITLSNALNAMAFAFQSMKNITQHSLQDYSIACCTDSAWAPSMVYGAKFWSQVSASSSLTSWSTWNTSPWTMIESINLVPDKRKPVIIYSKFTASAFREDFLNT